MAGANKIIVTETGANQAKVCAVDSTTKILTCTATAGLVGPVGVTISGSIVYVASPSSNGVYVCTLNTAANTLNSCTLQPSVNGVYNLVVSRPSVFTYNVV